MCTLPLYFEDKYYNQAIFYYFGLYIHSVNRNYLGTLYTLGTAVSAGDTGMSAYWC